MTEYCVAVTGTSRARFFTLDSVPFPEMESGPNLHEINDLVDPEQGIPEKILWSDTKSGRNRGAGGASSHGYDDHRDQHGEEFQRRFARYVAQETARVARNRRISNVILVAQKHMLGLLRNTLDPMLNSDVHVRELAKDLTKLSARDLHEYLAREDLLPRRRQPVG